MSLKDFLDDICSDPVDEVRILRKIFAAYDGTLEASLTVSLACNASIHKMSWAHVVRHASQGKNADDIVRDANVLLTKKRKQISVDPLLEICAEFTSRIFHSDLSFRDGVDALGGFQGREMLNELQGQIDKISIIKAYAQVQEDFQDFNAELDSFYGGGHELVGRFEIYKQSIARLRKSAGSAFIEAYQSRGDFVAPKRITIDAFVNTLQDCDIRLAANMTIDAGVSGGWWSNREDKVREYVETGRKDKKKKQLESSVESEQLGGGGQDLNYQEQINQRISDLSKSYGGRIVTLQRDLGIVSNDLADRIVKLRQEVSALFANYAKELETVQSTNSINNSQIQQLDIIIQALRNDEPQRDANTRDYVDRNLSRTIQQTESSINGQISSFTSNLYQLNDRLNTRMDDIDRDLNLKITQVRDQLGGLIEQKIQQVESRILELERK